MLYYNNIIIIPVRRRHTAEKYNVDNFRLRIDVRIPNGEKKNSNNIICVFTLGVEVVVVFKKRCQRQRFFSVGGLYNIYLFPFTVTAVSRSTPMLPSLFRRGPVYYCISNIAFSINCNGARTINKKKKQFTTK